MTKVEKLLIVQKNLSRLRREIWEEIMECEIASLDHLIGWCGDNEEFRLVLSFFGGSKNLSFEPSPKVMVKGLMKLLKDEKKYFFYKKPYPFVTAVKVR